MFYQHGTPTDLFVRVPNSERRFFRANDRADHADSTLCIAGNAQIPLRPIGPDGKVVEQPQFTGMKLLLDNTDLPEYGDWIVAITEPGNGKPFARSWTMRDMWLAACRSYTVLRYDNNDESEGEEPTATWELDGIFDLSRLFPSKLWDDGLIWRSQDGSIEYEIEVHPSPLDDAADIDESDMYESDPRIPLRMLLNRYRNDSVIKQLEER